MFSNIFNIICVSVNIDMVLYQRKFFCELFFFCLIGDLYFVWVEIGRYVALLCVSLGCYLLSWVFSGFLFHWFTPSGADCELNTFVIAVTLILGASFAIVSLHPQVWLLIFTGFRFSKVRLSYIFYNEVVGSNVGSQFVFGC